MKRLLLIVLIVVLYMQPAPAENAGSLILRAQQFADEGDMTRALACLDLAALAEPDNALVDAAKAESALKRATPRTPKQAYRMRWAKIRCPRTCGCCAAAAIF